MVALKRIAERLLLATPAYRHEASLLLYVPGECSRQFQHLSFPRPLTLFVSANNPGSRPVVEALRERLHDRPGWERATFTRVLTGWRRRHSLERTLTRVSDTQHYLHALCRGNCGGGGQDPSSIAEQRWVVLVLNSATFVGEQGEALAAELREARLRDARVLAIHVIQTEEGGCEFDHFFSVTPADLQTWLCKCSDNQGPSGLECILSAQSSLFALSV